jgi:hypothetical protein
MRGLNIVEFTVIASAMIAVIAVASSYLEKYVNTLTNRLIARPDARAVSLPG